MTRSKKLCPLLGPKSWSTNFNFEFRFCYCSLKWKEVICKIKKYSIYCTLLKSFILWPYSICKLYCPLNIYSSTFLTNHEQFFKILVYFCKIILKRSLLFTVTCRGVKFLNLTRILCEIKTIYLKNNKYMYMSILCMQENTERRKSLNTVSLVLDILFYTSVNKKNKKRVNCTWILRILKYFKILENLKCLCTFTNLIFHDINSPNTYSVILLNYNIWSKKTSYWEENCKLYFLKSFLCVNIKPDIRPDIRF